MTRQAYRALFARLDPLWEHLTSPPLPGRRHEQVPFLATIHGDSSAEQLER